MNEIDHIKTTDIKEKVMLCAIELFKKYGFKSVTMDDIARGSGISKKTLYQYFDNKNAVVFDTMSWYKKDIRCQYDSMMADTADAIEAFVRIKINVDNIYKEINPLAIFELQKYYPESYQLFRKNMEDDVHGVKLNLEQGIAEGYYRPEVNTDILASFHMESVLMIMMPNMIVKDRLDLYQVNRAIMEHYLYGIMTPKGVKIYLKYKEKYQLK